MSTQDPNRFDAALGCLLGGCVGDAAGATLEFLGRQPTGAEVDQAMTMPGGGVWRVAPGQITDDSELALCLARALANAKEFDPDRVAAEYNRWYSSRPFDMGNTISAAVSAGGGAARMTEAASGSMGSKANGSLMRSMPIGVWGWDLPPAELAEHARLDSQLTHPNPCCCDAVAAYSIAVASLIQDPGDRRRAWESASVWAWHEACAEVRDWLELAQSDETVPGTPMDGFVKIAFVHAFRHLTRGSDFARAIQETLLLGGDTDTNASIVGGLAGAALGAAAIPEKMKKPVLECETEQGHPRPDWLHPRQVDGLVEALLYKDPLG